MADDESAERFEACMVAIKRHFDREDFKAALPLCLKAAELQPKSTVVRRCHVFTLLSLARWADALQVCLKESSDQEVFAFERAYCLYRLNRFSEAQTALADWGRPGSGNEGTRLRLEAQVRYRMGDYENSAAMYEKLYEEDPEDLGLLVNAVASRVSGEKGGEAIDLTLGHEDLLESSYELCFNLACALIDEGRLADAEARLEAAKKLCSEELMQDGDLDEAALEDHPELAAIHVQRACVLQRRAAVDEANALYSRVLRPRAGADREVDVTVLAVAANNVVALRPEGKSLFDSLKRINIASKESLEHKLTKKQSLEMAANKCLLLLQARRLEEARKELQRMQESFPGHPRVVIIQGAIAFMEKKRAICEEILRAYLTQHPGSEEVLLALAQLYVQQQHLDKAVDALVQLPVQCRSQPSIIEAITALLQRQRHPEKAVSCLREAISFWMEQGERGEETLAKVLRLANRLESQLKDKAFAAEVHQIFLERVDGSDTDALCGLVQALVSTDVERAEQYAERLQVPSYSHLDPEELELAPIPKIGLLAGAKKREKDEAVSVDGAAAKGAATQKRRRKRKIRYPKGVDPENPGPPLDPAAARDRWLPKNQRAEFQKKLRKRDKNLARGPQGAVVSDDSAFRKHGPSTAQIEVSKDMPSRNQGRKKQGKK